MKNKRTVSIKDPRLRRFRDNLRLLIFKAVSVEWKRYFDERRKLNTDLDGNYRNLSGSKKSRVAELTVKMNQITNFREESIIQCPACRKINRDMTFNLRLKQWYCSQCYKEMAELYYQWRRKEGSVEKLTFDDFNEEFYETFLG